MTLLTPDLGSIKATVRGARRVTSRLGGHLTILSHVRLTLARGRTFATVTAAHALDSRGRVRGDLLRTASGLYLMELTASMIPESVPHPRAYYLVLDALRWLDHAGHHPLLLRYVELRLLEDVGYRPELRRCVASGREVQIGHHRYAPAMGGVVSDGSVATYGPLFPLSIDALKVLRFMAESSLAEVLRLRLQERLAAELETLLRASIHQVLERDLLSGAFLTHVATRVPF